MHKYVVVIGRFEPPHHAHIDLFHFALTKGEKLIIVLGSDNKARDTVNPWTSEQRVQMIRSCFSPEKNACIEFVFAKDYQSNNMWVAAVQSAIDALTGGEEDVKLVGHKKDASSFYLKLFPQWGDYIDPGQTSPLDATKVRSFIFRKDKISIKGLVPQGVYDFLSEWMETPEYERLHGEFHEILDEQAQWEGAPYQPTFVTTDAVVICSGHVLVVRRGGRYGKGLYAWPGGYIKASEFIVDSCIRELKEETGLKTPWEELKARIVDKDVFDEPNRDRRGRLITHAFCIKLPDGSLPKVKGLDDADKAWWMTFHDFHVNESKFFADHYRIGCRFINRF